MFYYCIEDQRLISILEYEPNVPDSVTVIQVTAEDHERIQSKELCFDVEQGRTVPMPNQQLQQLETKRQNQQNQYFLDSTDWKVLRHLRQQVLGLSTSLTQDQYIELEHQRELAARAIVKN